MSISSAGSNLFLNTSTNLSTHFYYLSTTPSQDGFKNQAELPRGVRGYHQPADQHGDLRQLRLSLHELLVQQRRTSFSWIRQVLQEGGEPVPLEPALYRREPQRRSPLRLPGGQLPGRAGAGHQGDRRQDHPD